MISIGQLAETNLRNPYLERHSVEKIVSIRGEAKPLTEVHDVLTVTLVPGSTYALEGGSIAPSNMSTVPSTGTPILLLNQEMVDALISEYRNVVSFVGKMYNTDILLPMFFKHFGKPEEGGLGEAYHLGVFGKTGSGKSFLARMICSIYARWQQMSIFGLDPTGEYVREIRNNGLLKKCINSVKRNVSVYGVSEISLTKTESLRRILLVSEFLDRMGVRARENQEYAANLIAEFFERNPSVSTPTGVIPSLSNAHQNFVFERMLDYIQQHAQRIYVTRDQQQRVLLTIQNQRQMLFNIWQPIARLFAGGRKTVEEILKDLCINREIVFVDLSEVSATDVYWNDRVMSIVIDDILKSLVDQAGRRWRETGSLLNLLVMTDEAHRFIYRETPEIDEFRILKNTFVRSVLETRKYGLGWMFISQSLATLDLEILRQMRIYLIGYGLSWGSERYTLEQLVGSGSHIELYSSFKDPQTAATLGRKEYPFMAYGPISPLSISGKPVFFNALDYHSEFLKQNNFTF
jgi:energy-coupling factor transporter ATP-binding protein EcfA2